MKFPVYSQLAGNSGFRDGFARDCLLSGESSANLIPRATGADGDGRAGGPCRQIDRPRQISDVAEKANRGAARYEVAEADLELDAGFVNLKGRHPVAATHRGR